ncbi:hypothetical protein MLD38_012517 [Melastoma candidum]|uniref:Uncharacterized protein n=1 Tax=Melastoma candidum TaxID=119954 RepID=A0ACB9R6P6_9MYRT|nr:hypothetical protein MLD38_012517 [Melastoma candidum]
MRKSVAVVVVTVLIGMIQRSDAKVVQFIFGDSLSDVGNNNQLSKSLAKASLPWYGIDFGNGLPNGRFSNGRTVADIIGDKLGLPRPPAFLTRTLFSRMGLSMSSCRGAIESSACFDQIQRFSLYKQIELFQGTQDLIMNKIGIQEANNFFRGSRYVVALGSNDFINNYLMPVYSDSWTYSDEGFVEYLTKTLQQQLELLYRLGARQLMVFGLGPMGCIPLQRVLSSSGGCQDRANKLAVGFNQQTTKMLQAMSSKFPDATFRFGDAYDVVNNVILNPVKYGFNNSDAPCCSFGKIRPALTCIPASSLCTDRSKYVFWDEYHPTDSANEIIANELIKKFGFLRPNGTEGPSRAPADAPASAPSPLG